MERALLASWNAELNGILKAKKRGSDSADAMFLASLEAILVTYIEKSIIRSSKQIFPGATQASSTGVFISKDKKLVIRPVGRHALDQNSLQITVLQQNLARQELREPITIGNFHPLSGLNDCIVFVPKSVSVNVDLLKLLVDQAFRVGYWWAERAVQSIVERNFNSLGVPFYEVLRPLLIGVPSSASNRLLLTFYYKETEYPILDSSTAGGFMKAVDGLVGTRPRQTALEFSKFYMSVINDDASPFKQLVSTKRPVVCGLSETSGGYYGDQSGTSDFLQSIYHSEVMLYPLVFRDQITLAANFHPEDLQVLEEPLFVARQALASVLDAKTREITKSLRVISSVKSALEKDYSSRVLEQTLFVLQNLPDLIEAGKAVYEAGKSLAT